MHFFNAEPLQLGCQGTRRDTEARRSAIETGNFAFTVSEHINDMIPLVFLNGFKAPGICQLRHDFPLYFTREKDLIQNIIISHQYTTLDGMLQLANIPRPVIIDDLFENILADPCNLFAYFFRKLLDKMSGK